MIKAHVVNHTHWDREWYFTTSDALVLSDSVFTEAINNLKDNAKDSFCLDGQTSILEEYLEIHPEQETTVKQLIQNKQLFIGPWYTQTDAFNPDSEAIIRNLIIGINSARKYGNPMMVGYLPDTFGFNRQMPTLLQTVGIDNLVFWRGIDFSSTVPEPYFIWKGLSKKKIYAVNMPFGYGTASIINNDKMDVAEFVRERLDPAIEFIEQYVNSEDVLIPSGGDQLRIVKNMNRKISQFNELSSYDILSDNYPNFIEIVRRIKNLPEYSGSFRQPVYARVHRSIGSVRTTIKLKNFELEQKIIKSVEPMVLIGAAHGIKVGNGLLIKLWKLLLSCQAHDTLGGCVSDNVANDINQRFKQANEIADGIINVVSKGIAERLSLTNKEIIVFNTSVDDFKGIKKVHFVYPKLQLSFVGYDDAMICDYKHYPARKKVLLETNNGQYYYDEPEYFEIDAILNLNIPAMGYKVIRIQDSEIGISQSLDDSNCGSLIENAKYSISLEGNSIKLNSKVTGQCSKLSIIDTGNSGDTYDYSPLDHDTEIEYEFSSFKCINSRIGKILKVFGNMELPKNLTERKLKDGKKQVEPIELDFILDNTDMVKIDIHVDNQVLSHRMQVQFTNPFQQNGNVFMQEFAGFSKVENSTIPNDWENKYVEKPVNLKFMNHSLILSDKGKSIDIFTRGLKEAQSVDNCVRITLFSTTSQLGKPNLAWRPGRASGDTTKQGHIMMETPLAEEIGILNFSLAISFHNFDFDQLTTIEFEKDWFKTSISYQLQDTNFFINRLDNKLQPLNGLKLNIKEFSLFKIPFDSLVSAVYPAYNHDGYFVLRLENYSKIDVDVSELNNYLDCLVVDGMEEKVDQRFIVGANDFLSILVKMPVESFLKK